MGLIYAERLASEGNDILLVSNQEEELKSVAADLSDRYGIKAIPLYQDLSDTDAADKLYAYCQEHHIEIDILINNAGMFFFKELFPEDINRVETMLRLHITTITRLSILFGNAMKGRRHGNILIVSSMAASLPMPGITVYSATKSYLKSFGRSLYFEMRPYDVGVTTVCPPAVATPLYNISDRLMNIGVRCGIILTPKRLVRRSLRAMRHRRRIIHPGLMNIYLPILIALLPKRLVTYLWNKFR